MAPVRQESLVRGDEPSRGSPATEMRGGFDVVGPGGKAACSPIRGPLRSCLNSLERLHGAVHALREKPSVAAPWMDWYIDNEYLVRRVLRMLSRDLSAKFISHLPVLVDEPESGVTRVAAIARLALAKCEQRFDVNLLVSLILEQPPAARPITAELWALPLLLRFETARSIVHGIEQLLDDTGQATGGQGKSRPDAARQVIDGIWTLHRLERTDWKGFFEQTSVIEEILSNDPCGAYRQMDFETRDRYRREVESLSLGMRDDERKVAEAVIGVAAEGANGSEGAMHHVGYYLIGAGRRHLEERLGYKPGPTERIARSAGHHVQGLYLGCLALVALLLIALPSLYAAWHGSWKDVVLVALTVLVPAATVSSVLVNWVAVHIMRPRILPKLDFSRGIPEEHKAAVCIAALIADPTDIDRAVAQLERQYLGNVDTHLRFVLLTGLFDSDTETTSRDGPLIRRLREAVEALNARHGTADDGPFLWLNRKRVWNGRDKLWMEFERKRGKLHELNRFILNGEFGTFADRSGPVQALRSVRYVITLDADTVLPVGGARRLVGTIAHPLNLPVVEPGSGTVRSGYTVLQPRVEIDPVNAARNVFTSVFSGDRGLDLYTLAVSDAYQDLFGEGIFTGKGLYHVAAFEASLDEAVPEGAILSHDLFEGIHGRTALVSDIVVYEGYPSNYLAYAKRLHRWVRGDWQLLPWLGRTVPVAGAARRPNRLGAIHRWQIFHNLLRSMQSPMLMVLLLLGWIALPGSALQWTVLVLLTLLVPALTSVLGLMPTTLRRRQATNAVRDLAGDAKRWILAISLLPHETLVVLDAVLRTLYRLGISRKHLLEWTPAAMADAGLAKLTLVHFWRRMWAGPAAAALAGALLTRIGGDTLYFSAPLLLLWLFSPQIAFLIQRPRLVEEENVRLQDRTYLRRLARRTWFFFERFVGPEDHWLPPDHFQENPKGAVAHRTSPTNIGLLLLSTSTAYDLGYVDAHEFLLRARNTLATVDELRKFRGHLFNWYDTHHLTTLPPAYVSTVDSGNLLGCLIAVGEGAAASSMDPVWRWEMFEGFLDTLALFDEALEKAGDSAPRRALDRQMRDIRQQVLAARGEKQAWPGLTDDLILAVRVGLDSTVHALLAATGSLSAQTLTALRICLERAHHQVTGMQRSRERFLPWWGLLSEPPETLRRGPRGDAVDAAWGGLRRELTTIPTFRGLADFERRIQPFIEGLKRALNAVESDGEAGAASVWLDRLAIAMRGAVEAASDLCALADDVQLRCERLFADTDMSFLYDPGRDVLRIGYNVDHGQLDDNAYDLLASEARLASFLAIAKGDVPPQHWIHLGRPLTQRGGDLLLLSWSGTLFEYLMPELLMNEPATSLLGQSARTAIGTQMDFGTRERIPWGVSESGYFTFDAAQNYGYHAFGVPQLALRAAKGEERVVAPYATLLALRWRPRHAVANLRRMQALGALGQYGFYEAIDFTPVRMPVGKTHAVVESYMAHHHGMSLVSLGNVLAETKAADKFRADPRVRACELYLQERTPVGADLEFPAPALTSATPQRGPAGDVGTWAVGADTPTPMASLLSNGSLTVLASNGGGGGTFWNGLAVTRWRCDSTRDNWGSWLYLRDQDSGDLWSVARMPSRRSDESENVAFFGHAVQYQRRERGLVQTLEVTVSPTEDAELRRLTLTNHGARTRTISVTTYAEVVLGDARSDSQHPAFSNLFVRSEFLAERSMLVFVRRPRESSGETAQMAELIVTEAGACNPDGFETDRAAFLGRGGSAAHPRALRRKGRLRGSCGDVLDPVAVLQKNVVLSPGETVRLAFVRLVGGSREALLQQASHYVYWAKVQRVFEEARGAVARELQVAGVMGAAFWEIVRLTSAVLYPHPSLRAAPNMIASNRLSQRNLWGYGISGDYPIVLLQVGQSVGVQAVNRLLKAHEFWRKRGVPVDLVILNEGDSGYENNTRDTLDRLISSAGSQSWIGRRGGIFPIAADSVPASDRTLLAAAAQVVVHGNGDALEEQLARLNTADIPLPRLRVQPLTAASGTKPASSGANLERLKFSNGYGGFSEDGREYRIVVRPDHRVPAPWINVIANPRFGFTVSESGGGYTWWLNSGENRLTPWRNDTVRDEPGEIIYVRDEETGALWALTPSPIRHEAEYEVAHGAGYTRFEHTSHGVKQALLLFVPAEDPIKIARVRLVNRSRRPRRLTLTYYAEWVLGTRREITAPYLVPAYDAEMEALLVRNPYGPEKPEQVVFLAATRQVHGFTADRAEFLGRRGTPSAPLALTRVGLASRVEAGRDTCGAVQVHVDLPPDGDVAFEFLLGAASDEDSAAALLREYRTPGRIDAAWESWQAHWEGLLGTLALSAPDDSVNILFNRWLLYQVLSSRLYGRTGHYQSSGAYGFRDQLQDAMALLHTDPTLCRNQILEAAARQFLDGDVLHWWHPPAARGVKTRISDDLLWLPFVVAEYVAVTGDYGLLDESVPYLTGEPLTADEHERYQLFERAQTPESLYEHCLRAIRRSDGRGAHGLPLIGGGDWNDGFNRVGAEGKGESVWLGWFLLATLRRFAVLCDGKGDGATRRALDSRAKGLAEALGATWNGEWFTRAYFDDGTPLGAGGDGACQIDSIAQSWAVLCGQERTPRGREAMEAVWKRLVDVEEGVALLFAPPFDNDARDPGYIAAYPPGVRENGGQYTHAAVWAALAFAQLGEADKTAALLRLLNPIGHADTPAGARRYRVEPYVLAADIYGFGSYKGRGGWTWYTGSAAWMYRFILEGVLGVRRRGDKLEIQPCMPPEWPAFELTYRYGKTEYRIKVVRGAERSNEESPHREPTVVHLTDDGAAHALTITV